MQRLRTIRNPLPTQEVCLVRLAVEELVERLDIAIEVLKRSDDAGVESLIEAVALAKHLLSHYVKPFSTSNTEELKKMVNIDKP